MTESVAALEALSPQDFDHIRELAYQKFGLDLPDGKQHLVSARLGKKLRELKISSFHAYYKHVVEDRTGEALVAMIDALTTNHTSFFREAAHFDFLRSTVVPAIRARPAIPVWSAACSSGEEPYSIAFTLFDELGPESFSKVRILATDISTKVLGQAQTAVYPASRFQGISAEQLRRYVLKGEGKYQDNFLVKKQFRQAVDFCRLNLMEDISRFGPFPAIFCRNVMIYFDRQTQQDLVNRLADRLEPGGYLFIGHAESLGGIHQPLEYIRPAIYRKASESSSKTNRSGVRR
jgi:chemotaxis protein methyltransferase CheR